MPATVTPETSGTAGDSWCTPDDLFEEIREKFNGGRPFDLDPCANEWSQKGVMYYTEADDGLRQPWDRPGVASVFWNPPYSNWQAWARRAYEASRRGLYCVGLLMNASDTPAYHDILLRGMVIPIRGRVKYRDPTGAKKGSPSYGSIISIFHPMLAHSPGLVPVSQGWWPKCHQERARKRKESHGPQGSESNGLQPAIA